MSVQNKTFSVKNGIDLANTIILDSSANLSNVNIAGTPLVTVLANAANTVAAYANGTLVLSDSTLNWNNTSTMNVSVLANGTTQTNISWSANLTAISGPAYNQANLAYNQANLAYAAANSAAANANGTTIVTYSAVATLNQTTYTLPQAAANAFVFVTLNGVLQTPLVDYTINNTTLSLNTSSVLAGTLVDCRIFTALSIATGNNTGGANVVSVYSAGGLVAANVGLNFANTATVNSIVTANGTSPANLSFTVNTTALIGGSNGQILFNQTGNANGVANITYNTAAGMFSVDANVRVANGNMLLFGGAQANGNANSRFAVTYNAAGVSLDFMIFPN